MVRGIEVTSSGLKIDSSQDLVERESGLSLSGDELDLTELPPRELPDDFETELAEAQNADNDMAKAALREQEARCLREERYHDYLLLIPAQEIYNIFDPAKIFEGGRQNSKLPLLSPNEEKALFESLYRLRARLVDLLFLRLDETALREELAHYIDSTIGQPTENETDCASLTPEAKRWSGRVIGQLAGLKAKWDSLYSGGDDQLAFNKGINAYMVDNTYCSRVIMAIARKHSVDQSSAFLREVLDSYVAARQVAVLTNIRFAIKVANQFIRQGSYSDIAARIRSSAVHELYNAVEKFDLSKGFKFSTYAYSWIQKGCQEGLREQVQWLALPEKLIRHLPNLIRASEKALNENACGEPSDWSHPPLEETRLHRIAEIAEIPVDKVALLLNYQAVKAISFDQMTDDGGANAYEDIVGSHNSPPPWLEVGDEEAALRVREAFRVLTLREGDIIGKRFGFFGQPPLSLAEIGKLYNRTGEAIRLVHNKALAKIRDYLAQGFLS